MHHDMNRKQPITVALVCDVATSSTPISRHPGARDTQVVRSKVACVAVQLRLNQIFLCLLLPVSEEEDIYFNDIWHITKTFF